MPIPPSLTWPEVEQQAEIFAHAVRQRGLALDEGLDEVDLEECYKEGARLVWAELDRWPAPDAVAAVLRGLYQQGMKEGIDYDDIIEAARELGLKL